MTEEFVDDFAGPSGVDSPAEPATTDLAQNRLPFFDRSNRSASTPIVAETNASSQAEPATNSRRRTAEPVSSEPKIERVVVTPDQATAAADAATEQPARRGWWQRRLGG